jgi:hypothetical protein
MTQKQSNNRRSGSAHNRQEEKRSGMPGVQQRVGPLFFFDAKRIVHREFVRQLLLLRILWRFEILDRKCAKKKLELWHSHNWFLHYDNAPDHKSLKTTEFVTNNNMVIVPHSPYSPDVVPFDFALFPILNMKLNIRRFETVSDIQRDSIRVLSKRGKTMESLYMFPRRLFWRIWQPKLSKLSQHFFHDLVWELSDTPRGIPPRKFL